MTQEPERFTREQLIQMGRARAELDLRIARPNLGTFAQHFFPTMAVAPALAPVYRLFDRVYQGEQVFALIEGPPRHGKSTNVFSAFARHLSRYPQHLIGYGSYNQDFANQQSRIARSIAEKCGVWAHDVIDKSASRFDASQSITHWQTSEGGGAKFVGRGGSALGLGFNVSVVDDPIKNPEEAESEVIEDKAWEWILGSFFNRMEPNGSFFCAHQRWNDGDPIGRFKKMIEGGYSDAPLEIQEAMAMAPAWDIVTLKAIQDDGTPLMPTRFNLLALARIRATIGEFYWWAQYMQDPRPRGGRLFPQNFARWVPWETEGAPRGIMIAGEWFALPPTANRQGVFLVFGVDTATSDSLNADSTAIVLGLFYYEYDPQTQRPELIGDMIGVWHERLKSPEVVAHVARVCGSIPGALIAFETMAAGKAQMQFLQVDHPELNVIGVTTSSSKRIRATRAAAAANRGRLRVPIQENRLEEGVKESKWVADWTGQLSKFTGAEGKRDDITDATAHMWNLAAQTPRPMLALSGDEGGEFRGEKERSENRGDDESFPFGQ